MVIFGSRCWSRLQAFLLLSGVLLSGVTIVGARLEGQQAAVPKVLRIGSSGGLMAENGGKQEKSARETLTVFIKDETGLNNEILPQKEWQQLVAKMAKGDLQIGVFDGFEYAWAKEKHPELTPLALAINVYRYPVAYIVVNRTNAAKDFAGLAGQDLSIPASSARFLRLFIDHESASAGKKAEDFFAKITAPEAVEDAIDDVVDGVTSATVVERAALEAFKRSKPGRFNKLRPVAHSQPFPPPVIAYYDNVLPETTRVQFQKGLLGANQKDKGQTMLTLFHLTGFEAPAEDFDTVVAAIQKSYPSSVDRK